MSVDYFVDSCLLIAPPELRLAGQEPIWKTVLTAVADWAGVAASLIPVAPSRARMSVTRRETSEGAATYLHARRPGLLVPH
jgi:hypothetical protein